MRDLSGACCPAWCSHGRPAGLGWAGLGCRRECGPAAAAQLLGAPQPTSGGLPRLLADARRCSHFSARERGAGCAALLAWQQARCRSEKKRSNWRRTWPAQQGEGQVMAAVEDGAGQRPRSIPSKQACRTTASSPPRARTSNHAAKPRRRAQRRVQQLVHDDERLLLLSLLLPLPQRRRRVAWLRQRRRLAAARRQLGCHLAPGVGGERLGQAFRQRCAAGTAARRQRPA
mgnify:CR=1 FL=1